MCGCLPCLFENLVRRVVCLDKAPRAQLLKTRAYRIYIESVFLSLHRKDRFSWRMNNRQSWSVRFSICDEAMDAAWSVTQGFTTTWVLFTSVTPRKAFTNSVPGQSSFYPRGQQTLAFYTKGVMSVGGEGLILSVILYCLPAILAGFLKHYAFFLF